jgi:aflatoxin B1 aldehyde reductase
MTCQHNGWVRPTVYQAIYNVLTRTIEDELIPACHRYGLDIVVYNPLAGGLLSGKITSKALVPDEGRFSGPAGGFGAMYRGRYFKDSTFQALQLIEKALEKHGDGLAMIEVALRWLVHHSALKTKDGNDGIIIGVSSLDYLRSNLDYIEQGPLPESLVNVLDEAWRITKLDVVKYWHFDLQYQYDTRQELFGSKSK